MNKELLPDIRRILEAGNSAPSGENCQPWHFVIRSSTIEVHLLPERDQSPYSWGQRASYLANGAAVENIVTVASAEGYRSKVFYFPNPSDTHHVASIGLTKDATVVSDPLAAFVDKRISNRKPYKKNPLTSDERKALLDAGGDSFALIEERDAINQLGRMGSTNEEVMLANQELHQFFFSHVNWTKEEDSEKKIGFYIKTLELPPPAEGMFKLFRRWPIMRVLATLGFNRLVAKQNGATNASAAAIGGFTMGGIEPLDFVKIGRTIEKVWLTATSLGLSVQPITGILFFKLKIAAGDTTSFSTREQQHILQAYERASRLLNADTKHIAFLFRVGRADAPSARAVRFPLADVITIIS